MLVLRKGVHVNNVACRSCSWFGKRKRKRDEKQCDSPVDVNNGRVKRQREQEASQGPEDNCHDVSPMQCAPPPRASSKRKRVDEDEGQSCCDNGTNSKRQMKRKRKTKGDSKRGKIHRSRKSLVQGRKETSVAPPHTPKMQCVRLANVTLAMRNCKNCSVKGTTRSCSRMAKERTSTSQDVIIPLPVIEQSARSEDGKDATIARLLAYQGKIRSLTGQNAMMVFCDAVEYDDLAPLCNTEEVASRIMLALGPWHTIISAHGARWGLSLKVRACVL